LPEEESKRSSEKRKSDLKSGEALSDFEDWYHSEVDVRSAAAAVNAAESRLEKHFE